MTSQQQPLPVPSHFHFEWDKPEDASRFWKADLMHWPNGISPLAATMDMPYFGRGLLKAAQELCMPFEGADFKVVNGYVYQNFVPYSTDPGEMEQRMGAMQQQMMKHVPGLLDRWHNEYEPEIRAINDDTIGADYESLGNTDLAGLLETLTAKKEREGELHFLAVFPAGGAVQFYEQVYTDLFGAPKSGEHLQLLQGFENKSYEADTALWRLAMEARSRPAVLETLKRVSPSEAHAALEETEEGRAFRDAVVEFLDEYGWRGNELDVAAPTWREEPATAYKLIREYAAAGDYDPELEFKSLVAAREARERTTMDRLSGAEDKLSLFRMALGGAQQYVPIQEDHNFWIDQQGVAVERVPLLEAGRRLQGASKIEHPDDVFLLTYDELQDALRNGSGPLVDTVAQRRRAQEANRKLTPPDAIGTPPPPGLDEGMLSAFFGGKPPESADPRVIHGNAASAGRVTATARVVKSLDESDRLRRGEVLVCRSTMPPWTPLFGIASAVVTDHGGVLSHTAIVAREYQIPAVVGTKTATSLIRDGQSVTVDGDAGTVTLEGE